ncbi:MAG: hypothetical protein CUN55_21075, partial [Phototrophicales bacterium]
MRLKQIRRMRSLVVFWDLDTVHAYSIVSYMSLTIGSKINIGAPTSLQTQLRRESARLWCDMVKLHKYIRKRRWPWPSQGAYEKHFKNKYA